MRRKKKYKAREMTQNRATIILRSRLCNILINSGIKNKWVGHKTAELATMALALPAMAGCTVTDPKDVVAYAKATCPALLKTAKQRHLEKRAKQIFC